MVANLTQAKPATYIKVSNYPGLYRHSRSGRYYGCKKISGKRRERSLATCDRKIAERRLKEWIDKMDKVDAEVEKTTLGQLIQRYREVTAGLSKSSKDTDNSIIKRFLTWWPHGRDFEVRNVRPSMLDTWLAHESPRLRNVSYNGYTGFLRALFKIAVNDRIISTSPAESLHTPWKKPQKVKRIAPTVPQFEEIIDNLRTQPTNGTRRAEEGANFLAFLGLAGVGQAEASALTWADIDWTSERINFHRQKTDTDFYVPFYWFLRPLLLRLKATRKGAPATACVFKIKDAKKALSLACKRLNFPSFSQRSLRQGLIVRLIRAKIDLQLIADYQGHKDGGTLILDTYTDVFSEDDGEYEKAQLAKLEVGAASGNQSSSLVAPAAPSEQMKGPKKRDALPANNPSPAVPPLSAGVNPYKVGDKVKTQCKGAEVEAEVTAVYKDEVQVKTPDGERRWRTIRTVQPTTVPPANSRLPDASEAAPQKRKRGVRMQSKRGV